MTTEPSVITSQPGSNSTSQPGSNSTSQPGSNSTSQPGSNTAITIIISSTQPSPSSSAQPAQQGRKSPDQVSYADSDAHAAQYYCCVMKCCQACCAYGDDKRWYYPWDKGPLCCLPLGCGWCFVCLVFPCSLCIPTCRNIICMVQEGAWDGTCFGACICGIPRDSTGRRRSNSEDSD